MFFFYYLTLHCAEFSWCMIVITLAFILFNGLYVWQEFMYCMHFGSTDFEVPGAGLKVWGFSCLLFQVDWDFCQTSPTITAKSLCVSLLFPSVNVWPLATCDMCECLCIVGVHCAFLHRQQIHEKLTSISFGWVEALISFRIWKSHKSTWTKAKIKIKIKYIYTVYIENNIQDKTQHPTTMALVRNR